MTKKLLFLALAATVGTTLNAQTILNGDFENWTTVSEETPDGSGMLQHGTKESIDIWQGQYSLRLENKVENNNVDAGVMIFGKAGNQGLSGGVAYSGYPDSLVGYAKYDIKSTDAAIVLVKVWAGGSSIGTENMFTITGKDGFVRLAFNLNCGSGAVDSIAIGLTSGNFTGTPIAGSWIIWDDLHFVGPNAGQIDNTDFENWSTNNLYENPDDWNTSNSQSYDNDEASLVVKSTDARSGNYSLEATSSIENNGNGNYEMGNVANFIWNINGGGFDFTGTSDTLVFWYKMIGTGNGSIQVNLNDNSNNHQGHAEAPLPSVSAWTEFKLPLASQSPTTKIEISFAASIYPLNMNQDGNILYIDDMALMSDVSVGMVDIENNSNTNVFPNPFQNEIFVNFTSENSQTTSLKIYSMEGKLLQSKSFLSANGSNQVTINAADLSAGMYQYVLSNEDSTVASGKLVK